MKCRATFTCRIGSIDYGMKRTGLSSAVFRFLCEGLCNRQIARLLKVDEGTVRLRIRRLAQQSLIQHRKRTANWTIEEAICYDGLENFAHSQYEPNNINQAIGSKSLFIYDFNFSPLNRKGRMSDRQKLRKEKLEERMGRFRKDSIRRSTATIVRRLSDNCRARKLCLATDQHFQYRDAIKFDLRDLCIDHLTISSKAPRVYRHILFPVNHADLLVRQHVKAYARETISFSKRHGYMVQKFAIFMAWKNYFRPQFTKRQKLNPRSNSHSPAMALGLEKKILRFRDYFGNRSLPTQVGLPDDWKLFHDGQVPNFRHQGEENHSILRTIA